MEALLAEASFINKSYGSRLPVHTIYFGGGTPSLLPVAAIKRILQGLAQCFDLEKNLEITLEANPGTIGPEYFAELYACGVNRLSLGVQSSHPGELQILERQHNIYDVIDAMKWARQAGFKNISLDLIFGLPGQDQAAWQRTLDFALNLHPDHLSLYALTLEQGTPMHTWVERGLLSLPDDDAAADMYELASEVLEKAGFVQYEISNWARLDPSSGLQSSEHDMLCSEHNLQYWRGLPYLGLGAGAHGYADHTRVANVRLPSAYIRRLSEAAAPLEFPRTPATEDIQENDLEADMGEYMMMALRLVREGVSAAAFKTRFGQALKEVYGEQIDRLVDQGLLEWAGGGDILRLTRRGRLLGNKVFVEFI